MGGASSETPSKLAPHFLHTAASISFEAPQLGQAIVFFASVFDGLKHMEAPFLAALSVFHERIDFFFGDIGDVEQLGAVETPSDKRVADIGQAIRIRIQNIVGNRVTAA